MAKKDAFPAPSCAAIAPFNEYACPKALLPPGSPRTIIVLSASQSDTTNPFQPQLSRTTRFRMKPLLRLNHSRFVNFPNDFPEPVLVVFHQDIEKRGQKQKAVFWQYLHIGTPFTPGGRQHEQHETHTGERGM
jgi:hypothetical protein